MAGQSGGDGDSASVYFLVGIILLLVLVLTVDMYIDELLVIWRYMRIGEFWLLSWIPDWVPYFGKLPIDDAYACLLHVAQCLGSEGLTASSAQVIDNATFAHFTWMPGIFFIVIGIRHMMRSENVSTRHNMQSLLKQNAPLYKHVAPFIDAHPEKAALQFDTLHAETAEFGNSMSPERFARQSPPPGLAAQALTNSMYDMPIWDGDLGFDCDLAEKALSLQLCDRFTGIERMSTTERRVYDQLTSGLTFGQGSAMSILKNALSETPDFTFDSDRIMTEAVQLKVKTGKLPTAPRERIKKLLDDKDLEPQFRGCLAERIMHKHGFIITGLMSLLEEARQGGVVAGSELLWVKRQNRTLWYSLNSVGRKVAFVEGAGPFAHWLIERHLSRAITHAEVGEAVKGLETALKMQIRRELAEEVTV